MDVVTTVLIILVSFVGALSLAFLVLGAKYEHEKNLSVMTPEEERYYEIDSTEINAGNVEKVLEYQMACAMSENGMADHPALANRKRGN